jgi:hypothetical protein
MRQGRLQARLDKLMLSPRRLGKMVTIFPDDWPADVQAAYDAASLADDTARMAAIIFGQTGQPVVFDDTLVPDVIEIRTLEYGPT